jgi:hypothetical protein
MKRDFEHSTNLLDALAGDGIRVDRLVEIVREHRARKRRTTRAAAGASLVALFALGLLWIEIQSGPHASNYSKIDALNGNALPAPEPFRITRVDDEGLLELLQGQPLALVELPDGGQELMIIVNSAHGRRVAASRR